MLILINPDADAITSQIFWSAAASIWATTVLGVAFGNGLFSLASIALVAIGIALVAGNWLERQMGKLVGQDPVDEHEADSP